MTSEWAIKFNSFSIIMKVLLRSTVVLIVYDEQMLQVINLQCTPF